VSLNDLNNAVWDLCFPGRKQGDRDEGYKGVGFRMELNMTTTLHCICTNRTRNIQLRLPILGIIDFVTKMIPYNTYSITFLFTSNGTYLPLP
jgi:hypothetical protein